MSVNKLSRVSETVLIITCNVHKQLSFRNISLSNKKPGIELMRYFCNATKQNITNSPYLYRSQFYNRCFEDGSYFKSSKSNYKNKIIFPAFAGIFSFFQTKEDEEESELIMTIKRSVLMIQVSNL